MKKNSARKPIDKREQAAQSAAKAVAVLNAKGLSFEALDAMLAPWAAYLERLCSALGPSLELAKFADTQAGVEWIKQNSGGDKRLVQFAEYLEKLSGPLWIVARIIDVVRRLRKHLEDRDGVMLPDLKDLPDDLCQAASDCASVVLCAELVRRLASAVPLTPQIRAEASALFDGAPELVALVSKIAQDVFDYLDHFTERGLAIPETTWREIAVVAEDVPSVDGVTFAASAHELALSIGQRMLDSWTTAASPMFSKLIPSNGPTTPGGAFAERLGRVAQSSSLSFDWRQVLQGIVREAVRAAKLRRQLPPKSTPRLEVSFVPPQAVLDGQAFALAPDQVDFIQTLLDANGDWISGSQMPDLPRPDRVCKKLPAPIGELVESAASKGFRIPLSALA